MYFSTSEAGTFCRERVTRGLLSAGTIQTTLTACLPSVMALTAAGSRSAQTALTITLDFALARATSVVEKLIVYPERMQENLDRTHGLVHSQRVLLALTQAGVSREDSYRLVQRNAMAAWNGEGALLDLLKADGEVTRAVPPAQLEKLFDLSYHLKHVDTIFQRVFG